MSSESNIMKDIDKAPEKVFLQVGDIPLGTPFNKLVSEEMTWSTDQQFQSDVLYIRALTHGNWVTRSAR